LLVEYVTYAEHHAITPRFNEHSFLIVLIKGGRFDRFKKRTLDSSTLLCDEVELLGRKRGAVNVQTKDLAEAGGFGRGKFGDDAVQANPRS
jgi:hypothetical protein